MLKSTFENRVIAHGLVMMSCGVPSSFLDIIFWDDEWFAKYEQAKKGKYDA